MPSIDILPRARTRSTSHTPSRSTTLTLLHSRGHLLSLLLSPWQQPRPPPPSPEPRECERRVLRPAEGRAVAVRWVRAMATYNVKLITPEGEFNIVCPDDTYILDQAEEEGISLPYSSRAGKIIQGQSDASYLDDDQSTAGYVPTPSPTSLSRLTRRRSSPAKRLWWRRRKSHDVDRLLSSFPLITLSGRMLCS